jgi:hypothetical protein
MQLYSRARLLDKPTVFGWHSFTLSGPAGCLATCTGCHGTVPTAALSDGSWRWRLGGRCRGFLRAIGTGS